MNLETRARRAVASLQASVAGLISPPEAAAARSRRRLVGGLAVGGALAAALLVVALVLVPSPGDLQTVAGDLPAPTAGAPASAATPEAEPVAPTGATEGRDDTATPPDHSGPIGPNPPTTAAPGPAVSPPGTDSSERQGAAEQQGAPSEEFGSGGEPSLPVWGFWAGQAYSCSAEDEPVELFYGGGTPGEVVRLTSPYGFAEALIDEDGYWEATVAFAGAPYDEPFLVTVAGEDEVWEFTFTVTDPAKGPCVPPMESWFTAYQATACSMEDPPAGVFYGSGTPGDTVGLASPYGSAEALVDEDGYWEALLVFTGAPYDEPFSIEVASPAGEVWVFSFTVVDPETGSCWTFEAYQGWGCSAEEPPTEYFWGIGTPGTPVRLGSPYGSAEAVVDEYGYWEATLTFVGAPAGEEFIIEVLAGDDVVWAFSFFVADPEDGTCWGWVEPPCEGEDCETGSAPGEPTGPAFVGRVEITVRGSDPALVSVLIEGSLPTPCHALAWDMKGPAPDGSVILEVYSLVDPDVMCAAVLQEFSETIELGEFASGSYRLVLHGVEYPFEV